MDGQPLELCRRCQSAVSPGPMTKACKKACGGQLGHVKYVSITERTQDKYRRAVSFFFEYMQGQEFVGHGTSQSSKQYAATT